MLRRLVCTALMLGAAAGAHAAPPSAKPPAARLMGKRAPDFALSDLDGRLWRLSDLRGRKIVALQFVSTSCHCGQTALVALDLLYRRLGDRGVQALAIGFEAAPLQPPEQFARMAQLKVPFLHDPGLKTARAFGARWPPCVIVVDRAGVVRWACDGFAGDVAERTLAALEPLLAADEAWNAGSKYGRLYGSGTPVWVRGRVAAVERCAPLKGMSPGVAVTLGDGARQHRVHLGPAWYVETRRLPIGAGDVIRVSGVSVRLGGKPVMLAVEVAKGAQALRLRAADGRPLWEATGGT